MLNQRDKDLFKSTQKCIFLIPFQLISRQTISNQFRKFGNMYFLIVGFIMWVGTRYPQLFRSAFSPVTTWGPIAGFISLSLVNEAISDKKRHRSDYKTNNFECIVVENKTGNDATEVSPDDAPCDDVKVPVANGGTNTLGFHSIRRMDIRQGQIVFIRNREMIPCDTVLLASSGDRGCAYVETSSIDGETNLKLRNSAKHKTDPSINVAIEDIEDAVRRIAGFTALGCSADSVAEISQLTTEPPNAHINNFSGVLKLPRLDTIDEENPSPAHEREVPLGAENLLLRGAVLRNTEWAIGIAAFTGTDTKLSQNTVEAPPKFSQLDILTNKLVIALIWIEFICIAYLSTVGVLISRNKIDEHWYVYGVQFTGLEISDFE